ILMVLTGSMAAVLEIYRFQVVRGEMQNSADAAATAAARELVDDSLLTGDPQAMADRLAAAREQARVCGLINGVLGDPVVLAANESNEGHGDVVLGRVDPLRGKVFCGGDLSAVCHTPATDGEPNAVLDGDGAPHH